MELSTKQLQELLHNSFNVEGVDQDSIEIPQIMNDFISTLNQDPTLNDSTRIPSAYIETLASILNVALISCTSTLGKVKTNVQNGLIQTSISGCSLSIFLTLLKFLMDIVPVCLDDMNQKLLALRLNPNPDAFHSLCFKLFKLMQSIKTCALVCDVESSRFSSVVQVPPIRSDMEKFCNDLISMISLADAIKAGILERHSTALNEVQFSQMFTNIKNLTPQYSKVFENLNNAVKSNYVTTLTEVPFSQFQHFIHIQIHYITLCIFLSINTILLNTQQVQLLFTPLSDLATNVFNVASSFYKISRFRSKFQEELLVMKNSYSKFDENLRSVKKILFESFVNDYVPAQSFCNILFGEELEKIGKISVMFEPSLNNFIKGVESDKRSLIYKSISIETIINEVTILGKDLLDSINLMKEIFMKNEIDKFNESVKVMKQKFDEFINVLANEITKQSKSSEKKRYQLMIDILNFAMKEFDSCVEKLNGNKSKYFHNIVELSIINLQISFCCLDIDYIYLPTLKELKYEVWNKFLKFDELYYNEIKEILETVTNDDLTDEQISINKEIISNISDILENPNKDNTKEFYNQISQVYILLITLYTQYQNEKIDEQIKFISFFLWILKRTIRLSFYHCCEIFEILGSNSIVMLNQLIELQPTNNLIKIQFTVVEQTKLLKSFELKLNDHKQQLTYYCFDYEDLLKDITQMKNTFLDIFKDSLEFKNITYLQDIVESNYQNAQEIIEELNTFDQYSKLFSEYKPETPNKFFSGPFITYILNDVTQFISTFLSISQNNNKKEISIQGLMFSYKLSDYYQYFPLLQETIDISRLFKMYSMEIPKSSAGLSIGELSEKQNINYMLQKIVKNIQNLLPIAEIVTNQMKKYFADEIKAQNTKANEKQISFDEANEVLKNTSQDSLELTLPELEEMFKPEIKTTTNAFDIEIETKEEEVKEEVKEKEKDVEEVVVEKEDKEKPVVLDIQFPPSYDGFLKVPFQFVPFLANDVESDIKSFDDIPGYIITPPIEGFEDEYEEKEFPHFDDVHFDVQLERKPLKFTAMIESEMPPKNVSQINIPPPSYAQQPVFDQTPKITRRSSQPNNALLGLPPPDSPIRRGSSPKFSILQPPEPPINHQRNKSQMPSPLFDDGENLPLFNKRSSPLRKSDDLFGARAPTPPSEFDDSPQNPIFDFGGLNNKTKNDEKVSKFDFSSAFSDFGSGNSNKGNTEGKVSKFDFGSGFSDFGSGNSNDKGNTGGKVSKFDFSSGFSDFGHGNSQNKGNNEGKASKFDFGSVFPEFGNNAGGKSTVNFREPLKVPADSPFSKFLMNGNDNSMFLKNGNDNNNGVFFIPPGEDDEYNEYDYDYDYDTFDEDSEGELESDGLPVEVSKDLSLVGIVQEYLHCLKDDLNIIRTSLQDYSPDEDNSYSIQKALDTSLRVETSVENIENSAE